MRTFKVMISIQDDNGIYDQDVVEREGAWWFVEAWLDSPSEGYRIPTKVISIGRPRRQRLTGRSDGVEWVLNDPVPKEIAEYRAPLGGEELFVVLEQPDWRFALPSNRMN